MNSPVNFMDFTLICWHIILESEETEQRDLHFSRGKKTSRPRNLDATLITIYLDPTITSALGSSSSVNHHITELQAFFGPRKENGTWAHEPEHAAHCTMKQTRLQCFAQWLCTQKITTWLNWERDNSEPDGTCVHLCILHGTFLWCYDVTCTSPNSAHFIQPAGFRIQNTRKSLIPDVIYMWQPKCSTTSFFVGPPDFFALHDSGAISNCPGSLFQRNSMFARIQLHVWFLRVVYHSGARATIPEIELTAWLIFSELFPGKYIRLSHHRGHTWDS